MKISILGTEYDFDETTEKDDGKLYEKDGYCDRFSKRISVDTELTVDNPDICSDQNAFFRYIKRHEILHAFLFESGLEEYGNDESLINWIAWQFPKLLESFKEVDAI